MESSKKLWNMKDKEKNFRAAREGEKQVTIYSKEKNSRLAADFQQQSQEPEDSKNILAFVF